MLCSLTDRLPEGFFALTRTPELAGSAGVTTRLAGYASTLQAELDSPLVREHAARVVKGLLDEILSVDPETGEGPEGTGRELALRLLEGPGSPTHLVVVDAVARLTRNPLWNETEQDSRWLDRIARHRPELAPALSLRTVHRTARAVGNTAEDRRALAARLLEAHRAGADPDELCAPCGPGRHGARSVNGSSTSSRPTATPGRRRTARTGRTRRPADSNWPSAAGPIPRCGRPTSATPSTA